MSGLVAPGSGLWLLRHDLRLGFRAFLFPKAGKNRGRIRLVVLIGGAVLFAATAGAALVHDLARMRITPSPMLFLGIDVGLAWLCTLMLAQTLTVSTQIFYERNDLDLLLSSPISPRKVLTVRALGIAVLASALYMALASLVVIPLALAGRPEFLAVYGVILSLALLATAGGLALALTLFAWIGPRRTRVISQILAALIGGTIFLGSQARNLLPQDVWERWVARIRHMDLSTFDLNAAYAWPARAFLGDPVALAVVAGVSVLAFVASTAATGRRFAHDAAAGAGISTGGDVRAARRRAAAGDRAGFRGGVLPTLVRKDVRLLARDPWLISQMALQVVYLIPLCFLVFRAGHGGFGLAGGAAALTFIAGQLGGNLTWVVISAEDAPELLACAPVPPGQVASAKLAAGLAPTMALAAVPILVFAAAAPLAAVGAFCGMVGATVSAALLNLWWAKPANRKEFRRRRTSSGWVSLAELAVVALWSTVAFMIAGGLAAFAPIPAVLALIALALLRRPNRYGIAAAA